MLTSSSPTISAPPSPSAALHTHARPYHASRRTSSSSCANSPRFSVNPSSRRLEAHPSQSAASVPSPVPVFSRSPQIRRKGASVSYSDAATQYTPPGYPPTYRPARQDSTTTAIALAPPVLSNLITQKEQGETSAQPAITEPPEPAVRIDPPPVVIVRNQLPARRTSVEGASAEAQRGQQRARGSATSSASREQSSPAKRSRSGNQNLKVMPLKYETCDVKDLGVLISDMLMELVRLNDDFPLRDGQLTRFHSRAPPAISVKDYLFRLIVHATLSPPILLSMVFYVDKLCTMYPAFTISSLTVHRFLITAATVAAKGLSDSFWTNSLYARVGGVSVRELALLELEFLRKLEWRIVPKPETLVDYYKGLVERGDGYVMEKEKEKEKEPDPAPTTAEATTDSLAESSATPGSSTHESSNS